MGLRIVRLVSMSMIFIVLTGCVPSRRVTIVPQKKYVACCDPGLNAYDKSMCKWMYKNNINRLRDRYGDIYEGVWQGCEPGKEPWRKWE